MIRVKICGITNLDDAIQAVGCGADEIGFNFYSKSKRFVSAETARNIAAELPVAATKIGVFVNAEIEEILGITNKVGLDGIQLHGDEDQAYIKELRRISGSQITIIKAFRLSKAEDSVEALNFYAPDYVLFDSYSPADRGGTGITLDWDEVGTNIYLFFPHMAYLAGGLTPENVAEAIRKSGLLYAVDVASGVESSPGKKDPKKVEEFIRNAKNA
jgi:phosphoribosylanthranilate isomerase